MNKYNKIHKNKEGFWLWINSILTFIPREWVVIWRRKERERKREVKYLQRALAAKNVKIKALEKRIVELENKINK